MPTNVSKGAPGQGKPNSGSQGSGNQKATQGSAVSAEVAEGRREAGLEPEDDREE